MALGPFDLSGGPFLFLYAVLFVLASILSIRLSQALRPEGRQPGRLGDEEMAVLAGGLLWLQPQRWLFTLLLAGFLTSQCLAGLRHARLILAVEKLPRHTGFRCPSCQQAPPGGPLWSCPTCGNGFDPFSTAGVCPHCKALRSEIPCPHCGTGSPPAAWGTARTPPVIDV